MDDPMDTSLFKRIADLINFQQQVKNNLQKTYEETRDYHGSNSGFSSVTD